MSADKAIKEQLLAYLRSPGYRPGKIKELAGELGVTQVEYRAFRQVVKELESAGLVVRVRHNRYVLPQAVSQAVGRLRVHSRGFGFVVDNATQTEFFVPRRALGGAFDGDLVRLAIDAEDPQGQGPEGRVVAVVEPTERGFLGTFCRRREGRPVVELEEPAAGRQLWVDEDSFPGLKEGEKVMVRIAERRAGDREFRGKIVALLGQGDDPGLDFFRIVQRFALPVEFSPAVDREAASLSLDIEGAIARRVDLREWYCVTIDPPDARDFDDAVSLVSLPGGGYRLGVHIADVSHFVRPGTALDREAGERGVSVYLLDRVIHMLPQRLAAELCTLSPQQERLALSVLVELDEQGEVVDCQLAESVIRSRARLTYEEVQAVFDGKSTADNAANFASHLHLMRELSGKRRAIRQRRGALDFELPEPWVELDAKGNPTALGKYPRLESHRLIEEFMLLANECVGQYLSRRRLPALYRVHPPPDREKLRRLADWAPGLQLAEHAQLKPVDMQRWLKQLESRPDGRLLNKVLLQTMMRAQYAARDSGHFGLACRRYVHFTAPIRRYPDLLVHRLLKAHLAGELDNEHQQPLWSELDSLGRYLSHCEQRAEEAERTYIKSKQLRYLDKRLGEIFPGLVSRVLRGGFFVELEPFMVDGFCSMRELDDYFEYDERRQRLVGRRTRRVIRIGAAVRAQLVRVDWNTQQIELRLAGDEFVVEKGRRKKEERLRRPRHNRHKR